MSVPAVLTCAGARLGLGAAGLRGGGLLFLCKRNADKRSGGSACADAGGVREDIWGRASGAGRGVLPVGSAQTADRASMAFPDQTQALAAPAVILLAVLSIGRARSRRQEHAGRCFAAGRAVRGDCTGVAQKCGGPVDGALGRARQTVRVIPAMLSLASLRYLPDRQGRTKGSWLGALTLLPAVLAAVTAGCLSRD